MHPAMFTTLTFVLLEYMPWVSPLLVSFICGESRSLLGLEPPLGGDDDVRMDRDYPPFSGYEPGVLNSFHCILLLLLKLNTASRRISCTISLVCTSANYTLTTKP